VAGGFDIGVLNGGGRQMEFRDQVTALCGSSLHTNEYHDTEWESVDMIVSVY